MKVPLILVSKQQIS